MPEDPTDILVLPYFEPSGSPDFISDAAGVVSGLKIDTGRGEIFKGIMESVTLYFAQYAGLLDRIGIDTSEYIATGGGAKSDHWLQIKADIMGAPFIRPRSTECGVAGAAILAGIACGAFGSADEGIGALVAVERSFEPDAGRHSVYREKLDKFIELKKKCIGKNT